MILYMENPTDITKQKTNKKPIKTIKKYCKLAGCKIDVQISIAFHTIIVKFQKKTKPIYFTIATKRIKYLGINLTKEAKFLSIHEHGIAFLFFVSFKLF